LKLPPLRLPVLGFALEIQISGIQIAQGEG